MSKPVPSWTLAAASLAAVTLTALGAVAGCQVPPAQSGSGQNGSAQSGSGQNGGAQSGNAGHLGTLPDLVGRGLQNAQDTAQEAGYYLLDSHDALGRGRDQFLDREWKVCFQDPAPGDAPTTTTVDFGAVRLDEPCPATDQGATPPSPVGDTTPDLVGKSVSVAEDSLGDNSSITFEDATGQDRTVVVPTHWQVCGQDPAAGAPYHGVPVTLTVTKFDESC